MVKGTRSRSWPVLELNFWIALFAQTRSAVRPDREIADPGRVERRLSREREFEERVCSTPDRTAPHCAPSSPRSRRCRGRQRSCGGCRGRTPGGVGGTGCSVTMPVRGSSMPMNGVRWLEYQMLPLESPDTSWAASSTRGSSYSVTMTLSRCHAAADRPEAGEAGTRAAHPRQPIDDHFLLERSPRAAARLISGEPAWCSMRNTIRLQLRCRACCARFVERNGSHSPQVRMKVYFSSAEPGRFHSHSAPVNCGRISGVGGRKSLAYRALQHECRRVWCAVNLHAVALIGHKLQRLADAQGVGAGRQFRKFITAGFRCCRPWCAPHWARSAAP